MNEIDLSRVTKAVRELCISACKTLPNGLCNRIAECKATERTPLATKILGDLQDNISAASELDIPICQDTGMAVVFLEIGQDVHFINGLLNDAVNEGVRLGYTEGLLRLSVVDDPLKRVNTGDNTPAIIHTSIVTGDAVKITVAPKGFGSENMSVLKMLKPTASREVIIETVTKAVHIAGGNPCPPIIVGVGIGGDFELCALLAKTALCREIGTQNPDPFYAQLEKDMLSEINTLGIGPQGFGGDTTALAVHIEKYATHIAGLPLAVNIGCHVTRHEQTILR